MKSLKLVGGDGKYRGPFSKGLAGSFEADAFEFALRGVRRTQHRDKQGQPIFIVFLSYEARDHLSPDGLMVFGNRAGICLGGVRYGVRRSVSRSRLSSPGLSVFLNAEAQWKTPGTVPSPVEDSLRLVQSRSFRETPPRHSRRMSY